jgi:folate-binding protein YgfZ
VHLTKFLYPTGNYIISNDAKSILSGPGILEHLDKIITTKIIGCENNEIHDSIICNSNGRILDQLKIYILDNEAIIINNSINGSEIRSQLVKGIPWNKKINVIDGDDAIISYRVVGTNITKILDFIRIDIKELKGNLWKEYGNMIISMTSGTGYEILEMLVPIEEKNSMEHVMKECNILESTIENWDIMRIELGIVDYLDINNSIPFDVKLNHLVKLNKGCYPGQEIHARLESRGKINNTLVRLRANSNHNKNKFRIIDGGKIKIKSSYKFNEMVISLGIIPKKYENMTSIETVENIKFLVEKLD